MYIIGMATKLSSSPRHWCVESEKNFPNPWRVTAGDYGLSVSKRMTLRDTNHPSLGNLIMKLASVALSLVVALVALVAVESASAQGFGYSASWSSGNYCQPQQYATGYGYQRCPPQFGTGYGYQRPCPPQFGVNPYCPPQFGGVNPYCPPMIPRCGTGRPW